MVKDLLSMDIQDGDYLHDGDKIIEFNKSSFTCVNGNFAPLTSVMTPIKLNDCVLNACGYVKTSSTTFTHKNSLHIITLDLSLRYKIGGKIVDYLHELQQVCRKNNNILKVDICALSKCVI